MQLRPGTLLASLAVLTGGTAFAADQTVPGAGNATAAATAASSPRVAQAERFLIDQAERIRDRAIRAATLDLLANPHVCIRHRIGLGTTAAKDAVIARLLAAGLVSADDGASFPGGLRAGVFPPALADGTACPQLPMPFRAALGVVAIARDVVLHFPDKAIELPMLAVSTALQASLRAQQRYAELAARGDALLAGQRISDDAPAWATFDEPVDDAPRSAPRKTVRRPRTGPSSAFDAVGDE